MCFLILRKRVPQTPNSLSNARDAKARLIRAAFSLATLLLAAQKKVASCRAAPGDSGFPPAREGQIKTSRGSATRRLKRLTAKKKSPSDILRPARRRPD